MPRDAVGLDDVRHVARLARLGLTEEQAAALTRDLNTILEHMDVLARVDTTDVPEYVAANAPMPVRADHGQVANLSVPLESIAPQMRDGFFLVPRLASHEDAGS